jgi:uncharacterized metal-binding protein
MNYKDFCEEKGLSPISQKAKAEYRLYINELEIENRPHLDEMNKNAQEVINKLSKKK